MSNHSPIISVMTSAALKTARRLVRDFGEVEQLQVSQKGPGDFVSTADLKAEKQLVYELGNARPSFGFMLEEQEDIEGRDKSNRWIVDPLDGTTNFLHGIPHFAISIAHQKEGIIVAGVVYDPIKDEMFWAERNRGAWMNNRRLRVSSRGNMEQSVLATGVPHLGRGNQAEFLDIAKHLMPQVAGIRRMGAASLDLAYVAAGRYEAYWELDLHPWDIAAGILLVQEAGGFITDFEGRTTSMKSGEVLATNDKLQLPVQKLIMQSRKNVAALDAPTE